MMKLMQQHCGVAISRSRALVTVDVDVLGECDACSVGPGLDRIYISLRFLTDPVFTYLCQLTLRLIGIRSGRYVYLENLRHLSHPPSPSLSSPIPWPVCPSPICLPSLAHHTLHHPDRDFITFVLQGLRVGFHIGFSSHGFTSRPLSRNHPSSLTSPQVISMYISEEVATGRMTGPLVGPVRSIVHCSPLGLVPKGRNSGRWRMIVDLSFPRGRSVNDGVDPSLCSLTYASIDDALQFITRLGTNTLLLKIDLKDAYRMVPVHTCDRHLLGICWRDQAYIDQALPFGLRSAPKLFTAVADAIGWALFQAGVRLHLHYLDDFLFFLPPSCTLPHLVLSYIHGVLESIGVPVSWHKTEGPATTVTFLGVVVDTARLELRLPLDKLQHTRDLVAGWRRRRSGGYKDFESLLGHLSHAALVIRQGRVFLCRMFMILSAARSRWHHVHLDSVARADLLWWEYFLRHWNGLSFFQPNPVPTVHVHTDASGSSGCGGVLMPSKWFRLEWPEAWSSRDITIKELVPVVVAAALWGRAWHRQQVCFHIDNMGVVAMLWKYSAAREETHNLLRCLYFYAAVYQFSFCAEHVPGVHNTAADALSRDNMPLFFSLFPQAVQTRVPTPLLDLLLIYQPNWGSAHWITLFVSTLPGL